MTSTDTFRIRIQRSEAARAMLMCGVYSAMIALTIARRLLDGVVMSEMRIFGPYIGVLALALCYEIYVVVALRAALRQSRLIVGWRLTINAAIELSVPALLLVIMHVWSPRGQYAALSAPALLLFPITILVSALRLRPGMTMGLGAGAAVVHAMLALNVLRVEKLDASHYPVLLSYSVLLALTGVAGMMVSRAARRYVSEAVEEAQAREQSSLQLAGMERDLEVARTIQAGLLPVGSPSFSGFDIAGMNKAADQTGGDYYDWQELPNGRLLVVMADVTGHGIGPALVMAVCRAYARASAPMDSNPASLMARLNDLLHPEMSDGRFITLAMAVLDQSGAVELVSAGHGPSLLYRARQRSIEQFGGDGLPLAVVAEESYGPSRQFIMEPGDVFVMLTDGVFEWKNLADKQFGTSRLSEVLLQATSQTAAQIVDHLYRAVLKFADGAPQTDDVTIVAIKRSG